MSSSYAQFTTIINVPPHVLDPSDESQGFGPGTQLNIFNVPANFSIDPTAFDGGEVNIFGGNLQASFVGAGDGGVVNIRGGVVGFTAADAGVINMSDGVVGTHFVFGGTLNMSGGSIDQTAQLAGRLDMRNGGIVNLSGGTFSTEFFRADGGTTLNIIGGDYRLDGAPVGPPTGDRMPINLPPGAVLTGTFKDGTPFSLSSRDGHGIESGTLHLETVELPAAGPALIVASAGLVPPGVRENQVLRVDNGGAVADHFRAGWGSTVNVEAGGIVGRDFAALQGSLVNVLGGSIGGDFDARSGSTVNISGGTIGQQFTVFDGSVANISGGTILDALTNEPGGQINISGGSVGDFFGWEGSFTNISGGVFRREFENQGRTEIVGGDFRLDDEPITELDQVGEELPLTLGTRVLSGTFADGTSFAFSTHSNDFFRDGLTLRLSELPPVGPATIIVPTDAAPLGVRSGQTVVVNPGGALAPNFTAGWGSALEVRQGGAVGNNLEIAGATADISGGQIGQNAHAYSGSRVRISGGSVGAGFSAFEGSEVNITGGVVGSGMRAGSGSVVNISGGNIGAELLAAGGSEVNISGGVIGNGLGVADGGVVTISGGSIASGLVAFNGSVVNISGGMFPRLFSDYDARSLSTVNMFGRQFLINGVPVAGLSPGQPLVFTERNGTLSGILADGSPFAFVLTSSIPGPRPTLRGMRGTLTLTLVPEPSTEFQLAPIAFAVVLWLRARRRQDVTTGG